MVKDVLLLILLSITPFYSEHIYPVVLTTYWEIQEVLIPRCL